MTFPVSIQMGSHAIQAQMHALPRVGDHITCAFPAAGIPRMNLVVKRVSFHQLGDVEGKATATPFAIAVMTDGDTDPELAQQNSEAMEPLLGSLSGKR